MKNELFIKYSKEIFRLFVSLTDVYQKKFFEGTPQSFIDELHFHSVKEYLLLKIGYAPPRYIQSIKKFTQKFFVDTWYTSAKYFPLGSEKKQSLKETTKSLNEGKRLKVYKAKWLINCNTYELWADAPVVDLIFTLNNKILTTTHDLSLIFSVMEDLHEVVYEYFEHANKFLGRKLTTDQRKLYRKVLGLSDALSALASEEKFCEFVGVKNYKSFNRWKNNILNRNEVVELQKSFTKEELAELKQSYLDNL